MGQARVLALLFVATAFLAACGQSSQSSQSSTEAVSSPSQAPTSFQPVQNWQAIAKGASISGTTITASPTVKGYQASIDIPTSGHAALSVHYDITMKGGPGYLGVLSGDGSHWLNNNTLEANGHAQGVANANVSGDSVRLVLQTSDASSDNTQFTINKVEYALQ